MRKRTPNRGGGKRWRQLALLLAIATSGASIVGYIALSVTLNGLPWSGPFPGWAGLIQPASEPRADSVDLEIESAFEGEDLPIVTYTVSVCGPYPYRADLLLGGDAQIAAANASSRSISLGTTTVADQGTSLTAEIGKVQLVLLDFTNVSPCSNSGDQLANSFPGGVAKEVTGLMYVPLQYAWSGPWGLWHGPHMSQTWPTVGSVGSFTSTAESRPGTFTFAGLHGRWVQPATEYDQVTADQVPVGWSIDSSVPNASVVSGSLSDALSWTSLFPLTPTAQFTDRASMALLQDWAIIFAVGFGIGGAMLASLLLDSLRTRAPESIVSGEQDGRFAATFADAPKQPEFMPPGRGVRLSRWLIAIVTIFFIKRARKRRRREL